MLDEDILDQTNRHVARGKQDIARFCRAMLTGGVFDASIEEFGNAMLLRALLPRVEKIQERTGFTASCLPAVFERNEFKDDDAIEASSHLVLRAIGRSVGIKAFEMGAMGIKARHPKPLGVSTATCDRFINLMRVLKDEALFVSERSGEKPALRPIEQIAELCTDLAGARSQQRTPQSGRDCAPDPGYWLYVVNFRHP